MGIVGVRLRRRSILVRERAGQAGDVDRRKPTPSKFEEVFSKELGVCLPVSQDSRSPSAMAHGIAYVVGLR
jgi:hypothetical protein